MGIVTGYISRTGMPAVLRNLSPTGRALPAVAAVALLAVFDSSVATNTTNDNVSPTPTPLLFMPLVQSTARKPHPHPGANRLASALSMALVA